MTKRVQLQSKINHAPVSEIIPNPYFQMRSELLNIKWFATNTILGEKKMYKISLELGEKNCRFCEKEINK